ncbi:MULTISPECIES: hypothetical protein [Gammaproteobacteria]|uniref:hypothetical protein n=1 Tax=Gammaproteobacteria TaxID=1236 RepID=UPI001ADC0C1A|nr:MULTISPECIES: hypothetical protein [Gammaproteobacteria]MBO9483395.1 hypothetical protein [Salinisphaera sp. G21_0]MBO9496231.1 hypothetical protein [Thalassotalea sp. G20_0]
MTPSYIAGASGYPASSRSENTAPSRVSAIWRTITGSFRCLSSSSADAVLTDSQRYSATPSTDLKVRDVKRTSSSPLDLPGTDEHAKTFKEVVRRIETDQQSLIMEKVNTITEEHLKQIAQCCSKPEQITKEHLSFFQTDTFAYAVLRAFREKKISSNEFATLVTLQGVYLEGIQNIDSFEIVHHNLFDGKGQANKVNWEIIALSLESSEWFFSGSFFDVSSIIEKMKRLFENAPPVEASFWSCKRPDFSDEDKRQRTMYKVLSSRSFKVLFDDDWWSGWLICPSITLRQAFIDSFCQEEAHKVNPVIGTSSLEDIRTGGLKGCRDMAIPFPGHPLPKTADHIAARWILEFMQHDFYHAVRASMLKNADIHLIIAMADVVRKIKASFHDEYIRVKQLSDQQQENFERSISSYSWAKRSQMRTKWQKDEEVLSIKNTLEYLERTTKALGQLAFNLDDLDTHKPTWVISSYNHDEDRCRHHLSNILLQLNSSAGKSWRELLSETDAGIVGQCVIPMISGNLSNPLELYNHFCRTIDSEINSGARDHLSKEEKQKYVGRSKKLIEPLNPSIKLDQSQWPTFLRETMKSVVPISGKGVFNE